MRLPLKSYFFVSLFLFLEQSQSAADGLAANRGITTTTTMPPMSRTQDHAEIAQRALSYFDSSTDPFHAVHTSIQHLQQAGFQELKELDSFKGKLEVGQKYYFTKNRSTLVAFAIGGRYQAGNGFKIIGGHTDSPNLRIKPRSKRSAAGCVQLGVECYGGGLWHTWFDRDLGISGRVLVRKENNQIEQKLVQIDRPLLRISNLAIHLQTTKEREAFAYNKEDHLSPILALEVKKALEGSTDEKPKTSEKDGWTEYQEPALLQLLAHELECETKDICDFELSLFDVQKAAIGGSFSEFVYSARLDNLASCFMALEAFVDFTSDGEKLIEDDDISMVVLYDHEEVGSTSAVGAAGPIMSDSVRRISAALSADDPDVYDSCIQKSFVISSDQAHAVHPNYVNKHEKTHQPKMNDGMVIKRNSNQRYATTVVTGFLVREIARRAGLPPVQEFIVRQDCGCGSTIGPAISAGTGIRTVDVGCPQLSMHSIRETMGVIDLANGKNMFKAFFEHFREVDNATEK